MSVDNSLFTDQLKQIISIPSVSCTQADLDMSNSSVIDLLANWLSELGFKIEIQSIEGKIGKKNLIATLGEGKNGLVFSGHTDTVPYNEELWEQDPFKLKIEDEKAFGLGATDMKGFFPTVVQAILPYIKKPLKHPIIILATADEESSMSGARALVESQLSHAKYAVIGEPTGMKPIRMHKGVMLESVRIEGKSGHSSNPALGNNALDVMNDVINDLKIFRTELAKENVNNGFEIAIPTLNLGCIHGGDNPNRICGNCELEFDLRPLPGMKLDDLRNMIDKRLDSIAEKNEIDIKRSSLFSGIAAFEEKAESKLIKAVERLTGDNSASVAFGTEAPLLQNLGMEVVVMGPGSIDQAHSPNEYIDLKQIDGAVKVMRGLIEELCL